MKYCEEFAALLDPFVDGELSPEEMVRVQDHLDGCAACRAYVDDALAIRAAFPDAEDTPVPDGFAEGVMARIRAEAAPRRKAARPWVKPLASLAACCTIVLLLGPLFSGSAKKAEAPAMAAATADTPVEQRSFAYQAEETPAETESAVEAPEEQAAEKFSVAAASGPTAYCDAASSTLTLPPEAASLLEGFAPVEETDTEVRYELSAQDCEALTDALTQAGIDYTLDSPGSETVLVLLRK